MRRNNSQKLTPGRAVVGSIAWLLMLAIVVFYIAVLVSAILIIVDAFVLKSAVSDNRTADIKSASDRLYVYAIILLVALSLNLLVMFWRWMRHRDY